MKPFYFGESTRPLFGVYDVPEPGADRDAGFLLCYPMCHEYMKTHWAFRRLAASLARAGFHVLRFDYYGSGDSAGETCHVSLAECRDNIRTAMQELKDLSAVRDVSIVGLRLGATLAAQASAEGLELKDLVLWNPVVRGADYIRDLRALQQERLRWQDERGPGGTCDDDDAQQVLLGFPFPADFREELGRLDLLSVCAGIRAKTVWLALSEQRGEYIQVQDAISRAGLAVKYQLVPDSGNWEDLFTWGGSLLMTSMPQEISNMLCGGRS